MSHFNSSGGAERSGVSSASDMLAAVVGLFAAFLISPMLFDLTWHDYVRDFALREYGGQALQGLRLFWWALLAGGVFALGKGLCGSVFRLILFRAANRFT